MENLLDDALRYAKEDIVYRQAIVKASQCGIEYFYQVKRTIEWRSEQGILNFIEKLNQMGEEIKRGFFVPCEDILRIDLSDFSHCGIKYVSFEIFVIKQKSQLLNLIKNHEEQLEQKALEIEVAEYNQYLTLKNKWDGTIAATKTSEGLFNRIQKCIKSLE